MTVLTYLQALNDIIRGSEPDLMLDGDPKPQRKHSCRHCRDGEREDGSLCPYEGMADEPDDGDDVTLETALKNMGIG